MASYQHKRSTVTGKIPLASDLLDGEIAINITDKKLFAKDDQGIVFEISGEGGSAPVTSVAGKIGDVTLLATDVSATTDRLWLTQAERLKLSGIGTGAEANVVDSVAGKTGDVSLTTSDIQKDAGTLEEWIADTDADLSTRGYGYMGDWFVGADVYAGQTWSHNGSEWRALSGGAGEPTQGLQWEIKSLNFNSIRDLLSLTITTASDLIFEVSGYHQQSKIGGGKFYWDSETPKSLHDGGTVIDPDAVYPTDWTNKAQRVTWFGSNNAGSGCWVLQNPKPSPEHYGAKGDEYDYDTESIASWFSSPNNRSIKSNGSYSVYDTSEITRECTNGFRVDFNNSNFKIMQGIGRLFIIDNTISGKHTIKISGGFVEGGNNVGLPLYVISSNGSDLRKITIDGFGAENVFAKDGVYNSSPAGVAISCSASIIAVNAVVDGVNRDFSNTGITASRGIAVTNVTGSLSIYESYVNNVGSPDNLDSDGIVVFSKNRLTNEKQKINNEIRDCIIKNCSGRFVKLQSTQTLVRNIKMYSESGAIIDEFNAIDCQFGGNTIKDCFWDISSTVTGGSSSRFVGVSIDDTGNEEYITTVTHNKVNLERDIRYFCQLNIDNTAGLSNSMVKMRDNVITSDGTYSVTAPLRLASNNINLIGSVNLDLQNNSYPCVDNTLIVITGDSYATNSATADKLSITAIGNTNTADSVSVSRPSIVYIASADTIPYLSNLVCSGNNCGGTRPNTISAKGLDVDKLKAGNNFYFNVGTMINAPSTAYDANVIIESTGGSDRISYVNGKSVFRVRGFSWYESIATELV